jgi:tRNA pseudouridine38-40 synthase
MQKYLIKISFDGTDYHGWQVQPNGITVQESIQNAMKKLYGYAPDVTGCSRTDAGVHAEEFYCHFYLENDIVDSGIVAGLNSVLKEDVRVLSCVHINDDFHCRYNAKRKTYLYKIDTRKLTDPFISRYSYHYNVPLDINSMNEFCKSVIGVHDFEGFSSANKSVKETVREIYDCSVSDNQGILTFSVTGNGFLYNMVRILVGTAIEVGNGRLDENIADEIFKTKNRALGGFTAPAKGLFLKRVEY